MVVAAAAVPAEVAVVVFLASFLTHSRCVDPPKSHTYVSKSTWHILGIVPLPQPTGTFMKMFAISLILTF